MAKRTAPDAIEALADLARTQDGLFSASQAAVKGVDRHQLQRFVGQRLLERDQRGLYRLTPFPESDRAELWRAVLWPSVQRVETPAVLSDGTALSLYEVSTINPNAIDITVPRSLRMRRDAPPGVRVRRRNYESTDLTTVSGLPVTTLYRTLIDLIVDGGGLQFVDEALKDARTEALLTSKELRNLLALRGMDEHLLSILRNPA
jgi:predicted transcriptional regulator of viral defense system